MYDTLLLSGATPQYVRDGHALFAQIPLATPIPASTPCDWSAS